MKTFEFDYSRGRIWFMAFLLTAVTVVCGATERDDGRDLGKRGIKNLASPKVSAVIPLNRGTGVPVTTKIISVAFSKAMDPATLTPASFTLACPARTGLSGAISYLAAGNVATMTLPAAHNLPAGIECTATVTSAAKDSTGTALARNFVWKFTTGLTADTSAPSVSSTAPVSDATGVEPNTRVTASFSEAMDPHTITAANFALACPAGTPVAGDVSYAVSGNAAIFAPASVLPANTTCTATISKGVKDAVGNALASAFVWSFATGAAKDTTAPTVTSTVPANLATGVALGGNIAATFSKAMNPSSITTATMTLKQGVTPVTGTVTFAGTTATFNPTDNLAANSTYTATMVGGASGSKDLAGNALASDFTWTFTTGVSADLTAPTVTSTVPVHLATGVPVNQNINASFSEPMNPLSITRRTFTLTQGMTPVAGLVSYVGTTATFNPTANLAANTTYTAAIVGGARGAKDLAGNPLASGTAPNPWTFTTGASALPAPGPALVNLDCAASFAVLAGSTVTNTGPTIVNGDLGLSPGSAVTGFPPGTVVGGAIHVNDTLANAAKLCLTTAYNAAAGRTTAPITVSGNIGGQTLAPGLYKSTSTLAISSGDLTLAGPADGVWIFQVASTLTTTAGRRIILTGGAQAKNVFWQVGTSATLGTTSVFQGNILADQSITLNTGAVSNGRALTRIGAVTLDSSIVTRPAP
ncbi:Ig-like domain-containing protein [Polaromonas sp.]|uniref:Ig-like domain-containing protein n=1 Tax=Polaromonas sp. TaxID=1869339 RepID=UPI001825FF21|nr:Ig-like domain-containing protein [Polaromonas sp.]NMM08218.1 DUF3494 domain-containing protein [Polaromonas sp.]